MPYFVKDKDRLVNVWAPKKYQMKDAMDNDWFGRGVGEEYIKKFYKKLHPMLKSKFKSVEVRPQIFVRDPNNGRGPGDFKELIVYVDDIELRIAWLRNRKQDIAFIQPMIFSNGFHLFPNWKSEKDVFDRIVKRYGELSGKTNWYENVNNNRSDKMGDDKKKLVELFYDKKKIDEIKKQKQLLKESMFDEQERLSEEDISVNLSKIKEYNKLGKLIYREGNLVDVAKNLYEIAKFASRYTVENQGDWFDGQTIQRNMKELKTLADNFAKVAKAVQSHQDNMTALYEDMGNVLNRYFEIADLVEEPTISEEPEDNFMSTGDRVNVDMKAVRHHNPTPKYLRQVKTEVSRGKGTVKIMEIKGNLAKVSGGEFSLYEVEVPVDALRKVSSKYRVDEAVKFNKEKVEKMAKTDKFLKSQLKSMSPEKVFDLYIKGQPDEEKKYNKVK